MKKLYIKELFFILDDDFIGDTIEAFNELCKFSLANIDKVQTINKEEYLSGTTQKIKFAGEIICD